jgi:hypothetical protein
MTPVSEESWRAHCHAVLDGEATAQQAAQVGAEIALRPDRAREFARLAMLHDALQRAAIAGEAGRSAARRVRTMSLVRRLVLAAAALALAAGAAWFTIGTVRTADASQVLARIVEVVRTGDRTYYLRVAATSRPVRPAPFAGRPQPSVDGAILYLRASDQYVLARVAEDGTEVLSGSDGTRSWIVPAKGSVRVSRDPRRFGGALPGSRQGIAFVDPHDGLSELGRSYDLTLEPGVAGGSLSWITAIRRPDARGGPKRVEIGFDAATSVIQVMRLDNLPQGRGGPRAVEFSLVDDSALPPDFFSHAHHHGADRTVIEEEP